MSEVEAKLPPELRSEDPKIRRKALLTLASQKRTRDHLEVFRHVASTDPQAPLRILARQLLQETTAQLDQGDLLEQIVDSETGTLRVQPLQKLLETGDAAQKIEAIQKAVQAEAHDAVAAFRTQLAKEEDPWVLASLLKALGALGDSQDIHVIQPFLKSADLRIQANAIEALELIGDELSFSLVAPHLQSSDARIRANAIKCLIRFDPEEAIDTLARMAQTDQRGARESALYCMGIVAHPRIPEIVAAMAPRESEEELLEKEITVLSEEGGMEAVGPLSFLAENLRGNLQERAALALGQIRNRIEIDDHQVTDARLQVEKEVLASPPSTPPLAKLPEPISTANSLPKRYRDEPLSKSRKSKAVPPPPPSASVQFKTFIKENPSFAALASITGIFVVASVGLLFQSPEAQVVTRPKKPTRAPVVRPNRGKPKEKGKTVAKGEQVTLKCLVQNIDHRRKTALLKHDGRILSVKLESTPSKKIKRNDQVEVRGVYTGKVRFGAKEFIASDLSKL